MNSTPTSNTSTTNAEVPASPLPTPSPQAAAPPSPPSRPPPKRRGRKRNPYRHAERPAVPLIQTVHEATETLREPTPEALRARLRRAQVVGPDGTTTAPLGPGIVGIKVGKNSWRIRFDAK